MPTVTDSVSLGRRRARFEAETHVVSLPGLRPGPAALGNHSLLEYVLLLPTRTSVITAKAVELHPAAALRYTLRPVREFADRVLTLQAEYTMGKEEAETGGEEGENGDR